MCLHARAREREYVSTFKRLRMEQALSYKSDSCTKTGRFICRPRQATTMMVFVGARGVQQRWMAHSRAATCSNDMCVFEAQGITYAINIPHHKHEHMRYCQLVRDGVFHWAMTRHSDVAPLVKHLRAARRDSDGCLKLDDRVLGVREPPCVAGWRHLKLPIQFVVKTSGSPSPPAPQLITTAAFQAKPRATASCGVTTVSPVLLSDIN